MKHESSTIAQNQVEALLESNDREERIGAILGMISGIENQVWFECKHLAIKCI